ncbi:efflux RND transporter periplasmic adaptor subunit [Janthinobacterium sp. LB3P118]|uniref:efflux RND transporter periplasmic adaptor subunit n=1 Tax=Janthinobacterium sp. LB3P118 TaxID=3424195 RepID=UPI003F2159D4
MSRAFKIFSTTLLVVFATIGCTKHIDGSQGAVAVQTEGVQNRQNSIDYRVRGTCVIRSAKVVRLKAQIGGAVKTVEVEQGSRVSKNQILATIDIEDLKVQKARTEIELEKLVKKADLLRFQIVKAEKEFSVVYDMAGTVNSYLPQYGKEKAALVERRNDLEQNELSQGLSRLDLQTIDVQMKRSVVKAPFDGVILTRSVEPGMVVGSGSASVGGGDVLFEVADPSILIGACIAKESDALRFEVGAKATILVDTEGAHPIAAKVRDVSPVITNDSGISRREFRVQFDPASTKRLLPGMNAEVDLGG